MITRDEGSLHVNGVSVWRLAEEYGTPLYIYDEEALRRRARSLVESMPKPRFKIYYSVKANSNPHLLEIIRSEGLGAEAVSPGEVIVALSTGWRPGNILFTGNSLRLEEVLWALRIGVEVNIDSTLMLERICDVNRDIGIRVNPMLGGGYHKYTVTGGMHAKFGIGIHEVEKAAELARQCSFRVVRLHAHIGSGIRDPGLYGEVLEILMSLASQYFPEAEEFDVGGGFYVPYKPGEKKLDPKTLAETLVRVAENNIPDARIIVEPGRYIVAESGILLARITDVKITPDGIHIIGTDTGMNHLIRPALYGAYHEAMTVTRRCERKVEANIVGNICESSDVLASNRKVCEPRVGDLVAIFNAGAYGYSMASNYNLRLLPAEILVSAEGQYTLIRSRQEPSQLVENVPLFAERIEHVLNKYGWPLA